LVCEQLLKTWRELFDIATPLLVGILKLIRKGQQRYGMATSTVAIFLTESEHMLLG